MTNFLTTLRALDAAATPGPWMKHKDPRLPNHIGEWTISRIPHQGLSPNGTFFVAHIVSMGADNANDADLLVHLRNRAAAIAGCVEALETIKKNAESQLEAFHSLRVFEREGPAQDAADLANWHRSMAVAALAALEDKS